MKKVGAQKTSRRGIQIEIYWKERKVHWDVRMTSKLGKLNECRMTSNMGRREYFILESAL